MKQSTKLNWNDWKTFWLSHWKMVRNYFIYLWYNLKTSGAAFVIVIGHNVFQRGDTLNVGLPSQIIVLKNLGEDNQGHYSLIVKLYQHEKIT
jgi:hypothetical protein